MDTAQETRRIVAHRGANFLHPENSLPAFTSALELGADEIEFDLWETADGRSVSCHDEIIDRTTSGSGNVSELEFADIKKLRLRDHSGNIVKGVRVPTVEEIFACAADKTTMNIHLKQIGKGGGIVRRVARLALEYGVENSVYIAGFRDVMECAADLAPRLGRCCLEGQANGAKQLRTAISLGCDRIQFSVHCSEPRDFLAAKEAGIKVNFYFCDEPARASELFSEGVEALLTNRPELVNRSCFPVAN